ncbi:hypothetical protein SCHPADRAFT_1000069 [Schizopora paradoxa]|uniref:F-box domain-containing protein n=1 Tax=Schizopora paradoxa TaxID=27342 RepID=A0A0H2RDS2_9AGAM|nr:hypothetical protein SCHPADRAFT_1000069 [Schizopora paradoxa]
MDVPNDALVEVTNLSSLPNEILVSIVDLFLEALDTPDIEVRQKEVTKLCSVCPKLREAILGCPKYWTTISSALRRRHLMQTYLTRSAGRDINIVLLDKDGSEACESLMDVATQDCDRWNSFSLTLSKVTSKGGFMDPREQRRLFNQSLPGLDYVLIYLQLPRLRNLRVHFGTSPSVFTPDFFTTWSFPGLQSMDLMNIAPKITPHSLTSFSLVFCNGNDSISLPLLQRFLAESTSIEKLSFSFEGEKYRRTAMPRRDVLANIRSLRLKIEESSTHAIHIVLRAFALPNLNELAIAASFNTERTFHGPPMAEVNSWKSDILLLHESFYRVSSLSLTLIGLGRKRDGVLSPLCTRFTNLKHFSLETNLVVVIVGAEGDAAEWPLQPLETIQFRECETLDVPWLRDFSSFLKRKGHWVDLHKLRIEKCDKLKRHEVLDVVPQEKLEWAEKRSAPKETFSEEPVPRSVPVDHLVGVEPLDEWDIGWDGEEPFDDDMFVEQDIFEG